MSDKIYKFGIVGAGMISQFHAKAFEAMPNAELVAIFDRNPERAEAFASENNCKAYVNLESFVAHDMDFVTICTPSGAHMEPGIAAANAGKHVIVEKPLDVTTEKIDKMLAACEQNNVQLIGVLPRRFNESTKIFKKAIEEGRFGKIVLADAYVKWWRTQEYYDSGAWRGTWALDGGGALMNQSIHTIDLLLHLMGEVKSVCAFAGLEAHKDIEVEDVAVAIVEFKNGARGVIQGSTACWSKEGHPAQVQISGDAGSAFMVDDKFSVWEFKDEQAGDADVLAQYGVGAEEGGAGAADPSAISFEWHQRNFEEAIAAVSEGRPATTGGDEGRKAVELICAIYESAKNGGQKVEL
ncbi:MAG: Gfo/Idh/MocA family oxidoreductase [Lentisphaerales bacterium]|nr:Gfo/Idh/MocA family oxidoreductase [Lentisphaerales bacterium]